MIVHILKVEWTIHFSSMQVPDILLHNVRNVCKLSNGSKPVILWQSITQMRQEKNKICTHTSLVISELAIFVPYLTYKKELNLHFIDN